MTTDTHASTVWAKFCRRFNVVERSVPLFSVDAKRVVAQRMIGDSKRPVLSRSPEMEAMVLAETSKLVEDWQSGSHNYDGLIYLMGWKDAAQFVPLYIGKAESIGKGERNLSANIKNLKTDRSKFARWGDNYAYHIGDLSACVLPGHRSEKLTSKYGAWATTLFENVPSPTPTLKQPVYFWTKAWDRREIGIWEDLGPTPLAFLEYLLIGVAGRVSPALLNREGVNRGRR